MRLKSIVLDGFKSYAHRQEVGNLDPHFNAITGLNGSGKSNIFDAICFVMGISNLKKVRAEDPMEFIYKNGHAGIQRASVTVEFENDDPKTAPEAFPSKDFPTISVSRVIQTGGRNKYFLNGKVSDQAKVKQFFHGVGMNVDNPHFLVLQGTVHKLVNMRTSEILGWLEEAAGTRVFDTRRKVSENLMAGKQKKIQGLNQNIDSEIGPLLTTRQAEQEEYSKYLRITEKLEEKRKFRVAFNYWKALQRQSDNTSLLQRLKDSIAEAKATLAGLPSLKEELTKRLDKLNQEQQAPLSQIKKLNDDVAEYKKLQAKCRQQLATIDKTVKTTQRAIQKATNEKTTAAKQLEKFLASSEKDRAAFTLLREQLEETEKSVTNLKESLRLLKSGVQAGDNGMSLNAEFEFVQKNLTMIAGDIKRSEQQLTVTQQEISDIMQEVKGDEKKHKINVAAAQKASENARKAEENFANAGHQQALLDHEQLQENLRRAKIEFQRADGERRANAPPGGVLQYDQVPGEDIDGAILGRLGELVTLPKPEFSMALSQGAGNHLMKVVISDDRMVQVVIEQGKLRNRTAFFPLNKIQPGGKISDDRVLAARRLAESRGSQVYLASDLVSCDPAVELLRDKVFGTFFVCPDLELAKELAFNNQVRAKAVTLEGDVADPNGLVSGGSRANLRDPLKDFSRAADGLGRLTIAKQSLRRAEQALKEHERAFQAAHHAQHMVEEARHIAERAQNELQMSDAHGVELRIKEMKNQAEATAKHIEHQKSKMESLATRKKEIESQLKDNDPAKHEKMYQQKLKDAQNQQKELRERYRESSGVMDDADAQKTGLEQKIVDLDTEISEKTQEHDTLKNEEAERTAELNRIEEDIQGSAAAIDTAERQAAALTKEHQDVQTELGQVQIQEDQLGRTIKDNEAEVRHSVKAVEEAKKLVKDLESNATHSWLLSVKDQLGDPSGPYYFSDTKKTEATLDELKENEILSEALSRKVNKKATMLLEQDQKRYTDLVQQRETLQTDKVAMNEVIKNIEQHKWSALDSMVSKVSKVFSTLFQTCLPYATCRLVEEREAATGHLTGVAVKVAFSGKEKESLSELSGGQRSLLALCLILAILRNRPAPMYILDEVDAALDPSHTQNIGKMLREHFSDAQFLLVSLKDGMFNNANIIYEVRNTQGYSQITRRLGTGSQNKQQK